MLKTGLVGNLTDHEIDAVFVHPGFTVTGCFYPDCHENNPVSRQLPVLSAETLIDKNEVLIFRRANPYIINLLYAALKNSRHVMLLDTTELTSGAIAELIKLREEAQTVVQTSQIERTNPLLHACLPLITHPSLLEIQLLTPEKGFSSNGEVVKYLLRMIDALLFLNPVNIKKIQALRQSMNTSSSCFISARIDFDSGSVANLLFSNIANKESFIIQIYQKNNNLKIDMSGRKLMIFEHSGKQDKIVPRTVKVKKRDRHIFYNELESFYQSILSKNTYSHELYETSRVLELSLEIIAKSGFPESEG
jgi:hypothetical protein